MVKLFYVRFNYSPHQYLHSDFLLLEQTLWVIWRKWLAQGSKTKFLILVSSFGGGFELMEAGGDKDGIWAILESGLQYVTVPNAPCVYLSPFPSISAIVSHIPFIVIPITSVMGGGAIKRAVEFGRRSVLKRLEVSANRKDMFYYLVCQYIICLTCSLP
jgi:hypothetical protein